MPFLRALLFLCAGILLARWYELPLWLAGGGFALCGAMAYLRRSGLYAAAAVFCFGVLAAELRAPQACPPEGRTILVRICAEQAPAVRGKYAAAGGSLLAWRSEQGSWRAAGGSVLLRCDTSIRFRAGDRLVCRGRIRPFAADSYDRLMRARGYVGTLRLSRGGVLERDTSDGSGRFLPRIHEAASERMARLRMEPRAGAVAAAMAAGDRRGITPELRRIYARTGTSHLLAVSGLHVGVVFLAANALLWWLPLLRYGHRWRNLAVIVLVWLYAAATGFPASAVRAATMFSFLQFALFTAAPYAGMNALAAAAFAMLAVDARYLFDVSFQLSAVAVAGIVAWGVPLHCRMRTGNRAADFLTGTVVAGAVASLATAPLVAYTFGTVSAAGVVLNPAVILLAEATVTVAALWIAFPVAGAAPFAAWVLEATAGAQNRLAQWAAGWPSAAFEIRPDAVQTVLCYLLFSAVTLLVWSVEPKKRVSLRR